MTVGAQTAPEGDGSLVLDVMPTRNAGDRGQVITAEVDDDLYYTVEILDMTEGCGAEIIAEGDGLQKTYTLEPGDDGTLAIGQFGSCLRAIITLGISVYTRAGNIFAGQSTVRVIRNLY